MQVLLLGLFVALFLHDAMTAVAYQVTDGALRNREAMPADAWPYLGPLPLLAIVLGPKLLVALTYHLACMRTRRKLGQPAGQKSLRRLERLTSLMPLLLLALFAVDLWLGALRGVRVALQHTVLIDEMIAILPTLFVAAMAWWSYYPVDRRLREAVLFRLADEGKPVYPVQSRGQYLSTQMRHQFGLLLIPLLAVFAWSETLVFLGPDHYALIDTNTAMWLTPLGVLGVFILSPLVIRHVWHTAPLPAGEVRERMLALCKLHKIRVSELLLWRTGGGLVNAAVTGLVSKVRFILLSDGLLDQVPPRAVEAVMAHEIAHVKLWHMIWMGASLITTLGVAEQAGHFAFDTIQGPANYSQVQEPPIDVPLIDLADPNTRTMIIGLPAFAITLLVFGWVSRRIERQADVFAARHLAMTAEQPAYDALAQRVFDQQAVDTMVQALQQVADLNHASINRKSWRHGSIAWRQAHLRTLVGKPVQYAEIDRVMGWIKSATLIGVAALVLVSLW